MLSSDDLLGFDKIAPYRLSQTQLTRFGFKKPDFVPAGTYVSSVNGLLRLRKRGDITQYRNNRGGAWDKKNNCLKLNKNQIAAIKREFDPAALGTFCFAFSGGANDPLEQATAHHRLEACAQMKAEGYDFTGVTVLVQVVDHDSQVLLYAREGEQWAQSMAQRVTNPDLLYGYYYGRIFDEAEQTGDRINKSSVPKPQVSQIVECMLNDEWELLTPLKFGKVWNQRHSIIKKANLIASKAAERGLELDDLDFHRLKDAAIWATKVWEIAGATMRGSGFDPTPLKELRRLSMFKGYLLANRAGLSHQDRSRKAPTPGKWATLPPERLACRIIGKATELRKEAKRISSATLDDQDEALETLNKILSTHVPNEVSFAAIAKKEAEAKAAKRKK